MNLAAQALALVMVVPLMTAPIAALLRPRHLAWIAATAASITMSAIAFDVCARVFDGSVLTYDVGNWHPPEGIQLRVGPLNALILLLVTCSSTAALLCGYPSIRRQIEDDRQPYFFAAWLLCLAGLTGITITGDAFNVFVFMEVSSLASYVLIASGPDRRGLTATFKYLCMGTIGATFYLVGIGLVYMLTGTLNLADMAERLAAVRDSRLVLAAAGFVTIGLSLKAALFPLHAWLPDAYSRAPHAVTAFLAAASTKVTILVLIQFDFLVFQANLTDHARQLGTFLVPMATLGIVVGSIVAALQNHLKKLLAWSSISQIGYILLGAGLASKLGLTAAVNHMFAHGIAKATTFLALAAMTMRYSNVHLLDLSGAMKRMPWTCGAFIAGGLSLIGMPGTAGFVSKWLLVRAALESGPLGPWLVAAIVISSLFAVWYVWKVVEVLAFGDPAKDAPEDVREAPLPILITLWVAALANVYFGFATELPVELSTRAAETLIPGAAGGGR